MPRVLDNQTDVVLLREFGGGCYVLRRSHIDTVLDILPGNTLITFRCEGIAALVEPHWIHDIAGEGETIE